ncbi:multidrug effflux MFS transporter [Speluncibacter jeojiensis]
MLGALSAIGPLATDMYLPALPQVGDDLGVSASAVQLTLTAFMVGLALGQLAVGPLSDGLGRRRPLRVGLVLLVGAAAICALAPSGAVLTVARLVQGLGSGVGMVIARAVVADRVTGPQAARTFSLLTVIVGVAPIVAPLFGGAIAGPAGWRGVFVVLTGLSVVLLAVVWRHVPETLPAGRRHPVSVRECARNIVAVVSVRRYRGYAAAFALTYGVIFGYISASPFVVQEVMGFSPTAFSVIFTCNAVGLTCANAVNSRLVGRYRPRALLTWGIAAVSTVAAVMVVVVVIDPAGRRPLLVIMFVLAGATGFVFGNAAALALDQVRDRSGTGSAVLGALQFSVGAVVSPLVITGTAAGALPMALVIFTCAMLAVLALAATGGKRHAAQAATKAPEEAPAPE